MKPQIADIRSIGIALTSSVLFLLSGCGAIPVKLPYSPALMTDTSTAIEKAETRIVLRINSQQADAESVISLGAYSVEFQIGSALRSTLLEALTPLYRDVVLDDSGSEKPLEDSEILYVTLKKPKFDISSSIFGEHHVSMYISYKYVKRNGNVAWSQETSTQAKSGMGNADLINHLMAYDKKDLTAINNNKHYFLSMSRASDDALGQSLDILLEKILKERSRLLEDVPKQSVKQVPSNGKSNTRLNNKGDYRLPPEKSEGRRETKAIKGGARPTLPVEKK